MHLLKLGGGGRGWWSNNSVYQNGFHQTFSVHEECGTILNVFKTGHNRERFEIERRIVYAKQNRIFFQNRLLLKKIHELFGNTSDRLQIKLIRHKTP